MTDLNEIELAFNDYYPELSFSESFIEDSLMGFTDYFTEPELIKFMRIACDRTEAPENAIRYFCGICWNKIKNPYPDNLVYKGYRDKPSKNNETNRKLN
jgi:hypothetical protein